MPDLEIIIIYVVMSVLSFYLLVWDITRSHSVAVKELPSLVVMAFLWPLLLVLLILFFCGWFVDNVAADWGDKVIFRSRKPPPPDDV